MLRFTTLLLLLAIWVSAQTPAPGSMPFRRSVQGQTVRSADTPAVRVTFDPKFKYIGGDRFDLLGIADAELHFFVDADANKRIRRYYWIQFEGYHPDNNYAHQYEEPTVNIGGMDFYHSTAVRNSAGRDRAGSDSEHVRKLLEAKGYKLPPLYIRERLVYLTDASKRNELMIIYGEDAGPLGIKSEDVDDEGRTKSGWDKIAADLHRRATVSMSISH